VAVPGRNMMYIWRKQKVLKNTRYYCTEKEKQFFCDAEQLKKEKEA